MDRAYTVNDIIVERPRRLPGKWELRDGAAEGGYLQYRRGYDSLEIFLEKTDRGLHQVRLKVCRPRMPHLIACLLEPAETPLFGIYKRLVERMLCEWETRSREIREARDASHQSERERTMWYVSGVVEYGADVGVSLAMDARLESALAFMADAVEKSGADRILLPENDPRIRLAVVDAFGEKIPEVTTASAVFGNGDLYVEVGVAGVEEPLATVRFSPDDNGVA